MVLNRDEVFWRCANSTKLAVSDRRYIFDECPTVFLNKWPYISRYSYIRRSNRYLAYFAKE